MKPWALVFRQRRTVGGDHRDPQALPGELEGVLLLLLLIRVPANCQLEDDLGEEKPVLGSRDRRQEVRRDGTAGDGPLTWQGSMETAIGMETLETRVD